MRAEARIASIVLCAVLSACATPERVSMGAPLALSATKPPSGFVDYCKRNPDDCRTSQSAPSQIALTDELWDTLRVVNATVNRAIRPMDDDAHYGKTEVWIIPIDGRGDCDDYVVAKRKMLSLLGIPEPAMRISVVLLRGEVRHAVLSIVTDRGDFVLDNMRDEIMTESETRYAWLKRQDPLSQTGWVGLN